MVGERSGEMAELLDHALEAHVAHRYNQSWILYLLAAEQGAPLSGNVRRRWRWRCLTH